MAQKTLLVVVGPTGIGKTALAIHLAKHFKTEIISADSRQFYKEMRIGTAVPSKEELKAVPHHFIQHISIQDPYSVGDFERDALKKLEELFQVHDLVVMAGGSGLYVDAVVNGFDSFPDIKPGFRKELKKELEQKGLEPLQQELRAVDPEYARNADLNNTQRVLRALEVSRATGKPYSSFLGRSKVKRPFRSLILGMEATRDVVYNRINARVDQMVTSGLLDEVRSLIPYKDLNALNTVGYKELFRFLEGGLALEEAVLEIKKNTRRFAKRQGTWFRKNKDILWVAYDASPSQIINRVTAALKE